MLTSLKKVLLNFSNSGMVGVQTYPYYMCVLSVWMIYTVQNILKLCQGFHIIWQ